MLTDAGNCPRNLAYSFFAFFKLIPMSSFAIEYFILLLLPPPNPILERDYLFTNLFPSLSYTFSFLYHPPPFSPFHFRFASNNFFQSFSEVSLRQLAQIYLVTIHPCDLFFFYFIHFPLRSRNFQHRFCIECLCTAWD